MCFLIFEILILEWFVQKIKKETEQQQANQEASGTMSKQKEEDRKPKRKENHIFGTRGASWIL